MYGSSMCVASQYQNAPFHCLSKHDISTLINACCQDHSIFIFNPIHKYNPCKAINLISEICLGAMGSNESNYPCINAHDK